MKAWLVSVLAAAALLAAAPARAETPSVSATTTSAPTMHSTEIKAPPVMPAQPGKTGWFRVANFEGQTASSCIGDPTSPRCAIATYVACLARGVYQLCNMSRIKPPDEVIKAPRTIDYFFRKLGPLSRDDLPANLDVKWSPAPDAQLAVIDLYQCDYDGAWKCKVISSPLGRFVYLLGSETQWAVAGVAEPVEAPPPAAPAPAQPQAAPAPQTKGGPAGVPPVVLPGRPSIASTITGETQGQPSGEAQGEAPGGARAIAAANLPARPDAKWKRITNFGADTQTDCIGNPKSPTCAVETFVACLAYRDGDLCAIAENYPDMRIEFEAPARRRVMDYRIRSIGAFKRNALPKDMDVDWAPAADDRLAVVDIRECQLEENWLCRAFTGPTGHFFYLKPVAGRWYVKDSFEPPAPSPPTKTVAAPPEKPASSKPAAPTPPSPRPAGTAGLPVPLAPGAAPAPAPAPASPPARVAAAPAIAALAGLPPRPGDNWRRVTNFGLGTDSKCVGIPRSPDCVLDTYVACIARRDGGLCALAENFPRTQSPAPPQTQRRLVDYSLRKLGPFAAADLPKPIASKWAPAAGDQLAVLDARECDEKDGKWDCRAFTGSGGRLFFLKPADGRWYVKDSYEP